MADKARVYAGFSSLADGMDGGKSASLILPTQCAAASNVTFRGSFPKTRPPFLNLPYTFASDAVRTNFVGNWQGVEFYDGEEGQSGWVISRGGRLFFLNADTLVLSEITPMVQTVVNAPFTVPGIGGTVLISLNTAYGIPYGIAVVIDGGVYSTTSPTSNPVPFFYFGNAATGTVTAGTLVLDQSNNPIVESQSNPAAYDFVYMFQAENYMIILGGQHSTIIFDGSKCRRAGIGEVPPGTLGLYAWGRIWIARPNLRNFSAGNLVYETTNSRADILGWTDNDFINEGGDFSVPYNAGPITSMKALATVDTSLGIGRILIGTPKMVFSVNAPVDRTTWKSLRYPIETISLLDYGPQGPRNTLSINNDMWHRATDGFRSFRLAQIQFSQPGNTPISREVSPVLDYDDQALLFYGSGILFDNRLLQTVSPSRVNGNVQHQGVVSINFDLISDLHTKLQPAWEGAWSGLNILQLSKATIKNYERGFAFVMGADVELWEIQKIGGYDTLQTVSGGVTTLTRTPIGCWLETRAENYGDSDMLKSLHMAELFVDEIFDTVTFTIKYRPDQFPAWIPWQTFSLCASVSQCTVPAPVNGVCASLKNAVKLYASRIVIPQPGDACNAISGTPVREGREISFRIEWVGSCRIRMFRTHASIKSQTMEGFCPPTVVCNTFEDCSTDWFSYSSRAG